MGGKSTVQAAIPPFLVSVEEAARALGIRRTKMYELLRARHVIALRIGRRTLVPVTEMRRYVDERVDAAKRGIVV